jgi:hypothetical protein
VRGSSSIRRVVSAGALAGVVGMAAPARAFEREWHAGLRAGFATLTKRGMGPALGVHGAYGLSDMFDVTLEALASRHDGADGTDVLSATAGLTYKIDVFQWIPYLGLVGGYYHFGGEPAGRFEGGMPGFALQAGLDYLVVREVAIGLELREHNVLEDGLHLPVFSATLGAEYRFGW